ncbi:hyaluronidase [Chitinophaga rhizophila]|uniref:Venom spreading factor n=1 Tax=Chitinophaga rhizophila TaxID=2866212 RepID=A0ABS7GJG3_9BACT|nr:hyaluronidase [Chitinophaga rhizophila]MBW8687360.1 hyaluronidase [Chitinophaga rhizophila]
MKYLIFSILIIAGSMLCKQLPAQQKVQLKSSQPRVYLCMDNAGSDMSSERQANNMGAVKLIGGADISSGNTLVINSKTLIAAIRKAFPDSLMQGIGVLDWEGKELGILRRQPESDPAFQDAMKKMMAVLSIAQQTRPNVSWGFYGIPVREFWKRNSDWKASGNRLLPLLRQQDALFPSIYLLYNSATVNNVLSGDYTKDNVRQAVTLGAKTGKPVLPFIYHRYPDFSLVPLNVFRQQARDILSVDVNGNKVAGIVWWGADSYYYRTNNKVLMREAGKAQDAGKHFSDLVRQYSAELIKATKGQ